LAELGELARLQGDHPRSRALLEEAQALAHETGYRWLTGLVAVTLARLARAEGDVGRADALVKEGLSVFRDHGGKVSLVTAVALCGAMAAERGLHRRGARLLGASASQRPRAWWESPADRQAYDESLSTARVALGERAFAAAYADGQAMTQEQTVAYAMSDEAQDA